MNNMVTFSIILPLYNKEAHISKTMSSILEQSFKDFELLVIDDGSTDLSYEIVKSINDPRIIIIQQPNSGPSKARNRGIHEAKGKYFAFIDADDTWLPQYLEYQHAILSNNPAIMWSCVAYKRTRNGKTIDTLCFPIDGIISDVADKLLYKPYIWTGAVAINSVVFQNKSFLFNEQIKRSEDLELWFKLACLYPKIGYTSKILAEYNASVNGSLTYTAHEYEDFSYLSLLHRINNELKQTTPERQLKITKIIDSFCKKELLKTWKSTSLFKAHKVKFEQNFNNNIYVSLSCLHFMPTLIKKIYVRLLEISKLS